LEAYTEHGANRLTTRQDAAPAASLAKHNGEQRSSRLFTRAFSPTRSRSRQPDERPAVARSLAGPRPPPHRQRRNPGVAPAWPPPISSIASRPPSAPGTPSSVSSAAAGCRAS